MAIIDFNIGSEHINVKTTTLVEMEEHFTVLTLEGPIGFKTKITADFAEIPEQYHEVALNVITSKYVNRVSFGHNPFSQCKPPVKRKWYQFWKSKYFIQ